jgi:hypothetical protein
LYGIISCLFAGIRYNTDLHHGNEAQESEIPVVEATIATISAEIQKRYFCTYAVRREEASLAKMSTPPRWATAMTRLVVPKSNPRTDMAF